MLLSLGVYGDGYAALLFNESHARDIRNPVPEINHILISYTAFGHFLIDFSTVRFVVNALGNTENILRFLRVIDGDFRPNGITAFIEIILASKDFFKLVLDSRTVNDVF